MNRDADEPILDVTDLRVRFDRDEGTVRAVNGVDFRLPTGGAIGIVGRVAVVCVVDVQERGHVIEDVDFVESVDRRRVELGEFVKASDHADLGPHSGRQPLDRGYADER